MDFGTETPAQLARRIRAHCDAIGMKPSSFTQKHLKNPHLVKRLEDGNFVSRKTYVKLCKILRPQTNGEQVDAA